MPRGTDRAWHRPLFGRHPSAARPVENVINLFLRGRVRVMVRVMVSDGEGDGEDDGDSGG